MALIGAGACLLLLLITWYVAHYVGVVKRADVSILGGFAELHRPRLDSVTQFVAQLCNPHPYVVLAAVPVLVALVRGRPRVAITVGAIMLAANETTQLLKPLLAGPRDHGGRGTRSPTPRGPAVTRRRRCHWRCAR